MSRVAADGSAAADAEPTVTIDRSIPAHRWRYTCPRGCTSWTPTNRHVICRSCQRADEHGEPGVAVEYYHIIDQKTGERIPWERVELVGQ